MIKSTKTSIKFARTNKKNNIDLFLKEYKNVLVQFVDLLWNTENIPTLLPKEITNQVTTWLSARMVQCAGKQASGIIRGVYKKQNKQKYILNKLIEEGQVKKARKLQKIIDQIKLSKPNIDNIEAELDSRFIKIDLNNKTSFDGWIVIGSIGNKLKIKIPFKKSKHFNKMIELGKIKTGIRIGNKEITFMFDLSDPIKKETGITLGIDIGQNTI